MLKSTESQLCFTSRTVPQATYTNGCSMSSVTSMCDRVRNTFSVFELIVKMAILKQAFKEVLQGYQLSKRVPVCTDCSCLSMTASSHWYSRRACWEGKGPPEALGAEWCHAELRMHLVGMDPSTHSRDRN